MVQYYFINVFQFQEKKDKFIKFLFYFSFLNNNGENMIVDLIGQYYKFVGLKMYRN